MANISKIKLPNQSSYDIKDSSAVHKTGDETIAGEKTFENHSIFSGDTNGCDAILVGNGAVTMGIGIDGISLDGDTETHGYISFPDTTEIPVGEYKTFATTDDIPNNILDGENDSLYQVNATSMSNDDAAAFGTSISGSKAFTLTAVDQINKTCTLTSTTGLTVGDECSAYVIDTNGYHTNCMLFGKITAINGNVVTFDNFFSDSTLTTLTTGSCLWVKGKPTIGNIIIGEHAFAEGRLTNAVQDAAHAEGRETIALGKFSHAEGRGSVAGGYCSHAEGRDTKTKGMYAFAGGRNSEANGDCSFAAIQGKANGLNSLSVGTSTQANGDYSIALGHGTVVAGNEAIGIGQNNTASAVSATAIGSSNTASGNYAAAFNYNNTASGHGASALGTGTTASGGRALSFGYNTQALNTTSVAGGASSIANGDSSIAFGTRANSTAANQVVFGKDNATNNNALLIIGDGTSQSAKHNAFEVLASDVKSNGVSLERTSNKVTSVSASSTDTEYPSAKAVYSAINSAIGVAIANSY